MFESSLFVGNTFIYFTFDGAEYISDSTRVVVFSCLTAVSFLGLLTLFLIRPLPTTSQESENESDAAQLVGDAVQEVTESKWKKASESAKTAFLNAIRILKTEEVLLQIVVWAYNGLEITFWSGILPTCIGNTMALPNRYSVVGLAGIVVGVGEMLGAFLTMITGRRSDPPRGPLIIFGMICQGIGFYLCLLYLPDDSTTSRVGTYSPTWAEPSTASILTTAFFLGLGDSMYQNQIVSLIGLIFPEEENASASFALFQFIQALAAASAFFYSVYVGLMYQLLILVVFMLVGTTCFLYLEVKYAKKFPIGEES